MHSVTDSLCSICAWEVHGWGHRREAGFLFVAIGDVRFRTKVRRTASLVDLDQSASAHGIPPDMAHLLIQKLPAVELTVFHILEADLHQVFTVNNAMAVQT